MEQLKVGKAMLTWLNGGVATVDGAPMFGVVPRKVWGEHYPHDGDYYIEMEQSPILIQLEGKNYLIDAGFGEGKMSDNYKRNASVRNETALENELAKLNLKPSDIDAILMTHLHFDHASGLTKPAGEGQFISAFPDVPIYVTETEWDEVRNPNLRTRGTYVKENWQPIENQVQLFTKEIFITENLRLIHTGGHSKGHAIVVYEDGDDCFIHMADIMPTHAHAHFLWVISYDDYPMDSIAGKIKWMKYGYEREAWYTFFHDAYLRAIKYDKNGQAIDTLKIKK